MISFVNFYFSYHDYLSFVLWAIVLSLFYYLFISTFLEMNMDLLKKTLSGKPYFISAVFASINTLLYIFVIYNFAQIYVYRGANSLGVLFLLIAWSFSVIKINKRFNARPWFSFLLFNVAWLGILFLWFQ